MSDSLKSQVRDLVWSQIEKYYNVDKTQPYVLTSKSIINTNPINNISDNITSVIEQILNAQQELMKNQIELEINKQREALIDKSPYSLDDNDQDFAVDKSDDHLYSLYGDDEDDADFD